MADDGIPLGNMTFRQAFPFTHIFRSFRIATHLSKLFLALFLLLLIYGGGRFLDGVWPAHDLATAGDLGYVQPGSFFDSPQGIFITFFSYEIQQVDNVSESVATLEWPGLLNSLDRFFITGPDWFYSQHPLFAGIFTVWFILIWSIFGGAIARIAAVHVTREEKIAVRQALRFSVGKILSFIFAPLIPLGIFAVLGVVLAAAGIILLHIPYAGPIALGIFFVLALAIGFVMTLILIGLAGGFNLMFPTIAVEGSDSFDAISRSFSYVYARPWRLLWYFLVAVVYGGITYLFVRYIIWMVLALTHYFIGWWLSGHAGVRWDMGIWPVPSLVPLPYRVDFASLHNWGDKTGAVLISIWVYLTIALLGAFAISFYFSASTIVYVLLRSKVDATDLDDIYLHDAEDEFAETPVEK
ncbi:MAG TPA: hypothetical protein VG722_08205 [Tepidisphaeraceae bacterium]|nr:hypothetical protein [Tepidisphaeraceae bacterium]